MQWKRETSTRKVCPRVLNVVILFNYLKTIVQKKNVIEGHLWAGNKLAQNLFAGELLYWFTCLHRETCLLVGLSLIPRKWFVSYKSFPIKELWMINSCLANSPSVCMYIIIQLYAPLQLHPRLMSVFLWSIAFKTTAPQNVTEHT